MAAADPTPNATLSALAREFSDPGWELFNTTVFSSIRKWAMCDFGKHGTFYLGAPEILLQKNDYESHALVKTNALEGKRILALTHTSNPPEDPEILSETSSVCLVLFEDTVREDAPEILEYFHDQGINLKVISGDHPSTVAAVAKRAGIPDSEKVLDARDLNNVENFDDLIEDTTIFGRVKPHQKREMIAALQRKGHTVAMTGDGVNDVLALKDADMGIAMGSGSSASRSVAQLVLLDNQFKILPRVLAEGRRVINNIERVSNLFITKATYAILLTILVGVLGVPFPFRPKQLTLIGTFSIGIPGFFLALAPDISLVKPGFLKRVLRYSIPAGMVVATSTFVSYEIVRHLEVNLAEARTSATVTLLGLGLVVLIFVSRPIRSWKIILVLSMAMAYVCVLLNETGREYFEIVKLSNDAWLTAIACIFAGFLPLAFISHRVKKYF